MNTIDDPRHDREVGARDSTLDLTRIDDVRIGAVRPLITPALLQERVPVHDDTLALVESSRAAVAAVLHGRDDRLVVVVGPCSIHDHDQAIEYGHRLKAVADELRGDLMIVMRAYFETTRAQARAELGLPDDLFVLAVFGALAGALRINDACVAAYGAEGLDDGVIHVASAPLQRRRTHVSPPPSG